MFLNKRKKIVLFMAGMTAASLGMAQSEVVIESTGIRYFELSYFDQFDPVTALDLVERTPGFSPQEQSGGRGLDGVRSNLLINGKRPPPKGQSIWEQLSNQPYSSVSRIELIDVGARSDIDMQGYTQVANVILENESSNYYEFSPTYSRSGTGDPDQVNEDVLDMDATSTFNWKGHEFSARAGTFDLSGSSPPDFVGIDPANPVQRISTKSQTEIDEQYAEISAIFNLPDDSTFSANAEMSSWDRTSEPLSGQGSAGSPASVNQTSMNESDWREMSAEYRRPVGDRSEVMFAVVDSRNVDSSESSFSINTTRLSSVRGSESGETAARLRLMYKPGDRLTLRTTLSSAFNYFEGNYQVFENGQLLPLSGGDSLVEEDRHSLTLEADYNWGESWVLNGSLTGGTYAIEARSDTQSVTSNKQSEVKGNVAATYQLASRTTLKFESRYDIGQLSLNQFLASSNLSSIILTAGAVSLDSEQTWEHKLSYDQRFGDRGVLKFTVGHMNLENPIRSVALSNSLVVSQNTFAEKRNWFNASVEYPFEYFDMDDLVLDAWFTVNDSETIDPVTLEKREVSWVRPLEWSVGLHKNPGETNWAWGFNVWKRINNKDYWVREIREQKNDHEWQAYVEWEIISGLKLKARVESPRDENRVSSLYSSVRQPGQDPSYITERNSRRESGTTFEIEWRREKYLEITARINPRSAFYSEEELRAYGATSGTVLAREVAESPRAEVQFRIYNR